ncbi:LuxR C-terminal-related transcriptional regulator [Plantactinospora sp. WMMC1484]|uniref:LuxR C-terminal-related transcriptional regulator n=1 Tax=Plantactinospora sp. WMMC1484 TaxID=3404122 RepID=UPI003BF5C54D
MAGRKTGVLAIGRAVPALVRWGVSADADLVYRCLLTFGPQAAGKVAAELGLGMRRARTALDELLAVDIITVEREPSGHGADASIWRARPAAAVVMTLRRHALRRAAAAAGSDPEPCERVALSARHLPDRESRRRRIAELAALERVEHLSMQPEQAFSTDELAVGAPLDVAALRRGVRMRTLSRPPADGDRSAQHAIDFGRLGGEYREAARLPQKLMIFDRRVALLAVDPLDLERGTWEIVDHAAVDALVRLFTRHWSDAVDPSRNGVPAIVLTSREKAIVALLAQGYTDAASAQEIGMSTRSLTYTLRALMDRLGVDNRFQLGLALGALNVATPPGPSTPAATIDGGNR